MASVLPLIVTEIVLLPVVEATKYQISVSMPTVRVLAALVNTAPFQDAEPMVPLPATSCQMDAVRTMRGFEPLLVIVQVLVIVLLKPSVILVVVDVSAIVDVEMAPPPPVVIVVVATAVTASGSA
jgi:hypothetical protein